MSVVIRVNDFKQFVLTYLGPAFALIGTYKTLILVSVCTMRAFKTGLRVQECSSDHCCQNQSTTDVSGSTCSEFF